MLALPQAPEAAPVAFDPDGVPLVGVPDDPELPDVLEPEEPLPVVPLLPPSLDVLSFLALASLALASLALASDLSAGFASPSLDDFFGALP
jgi:hypothetical protein